MIEQAIATYCICDEVCKSLNIKDDIQCKMSEPEVITFAILSVEFYGGNYRKARLMLTHYNCFKQILSLSRLVRRIHKIPEAVWMLVFSALQLLLRNPAISTFIVDSFPVKAYENYKSFRARIFTDKEYHGFCASKKMYFFGLKVHMIVDTDGVPIEFAFSPGSSSDVKTLETFSLALPKGSFLTGDKAYTSYQLEDNLKELEGIKLLPKRRINLKRQNSAGENFILDTQRNKVEAVFSAIVSRMPRSISARTEKGFCLKILLFILSMMNLFSPIS